MINKFKRLLCFAVALTIAFIVPNFSNENISAVNTDVTYYSYNAKTGQFIEEYDLESLDTVGMVNSRSGSTDDRVLDWTKHGVVKIFCKNLDDLQTSRGTGFVVGEHVIATAAHVVNGTAINKILIFKGNANDYMELTPVEYHLPKIYHEEHKIEIILNHPDRMNAEIEARCHDYALITVEEDLSDYMCFNLGVATDEAIENNTAVTLTGFPGTVHDEFNHVNNEKTNNMYSGTGVLLDMSEHINEYVDLYINNKDLIFCYDNRSSSGASGGPVYITESYAGNVYYTVVGINVAGGGTECRMGVRMTTDLLHFYMNNNYLDW